MCLRSLGSTLALLTLSLNVLICQERFNLRLIGDLNACNFIGIEELNEGYLLSAQALFEDNSNNFDVMSSVQITALGEIIEIKNYQQISGAYVLNPNSGLSKLDEPFEFCSLGQTTLNGLTRGFVANFNEAGDTISIVEFYSPYLENSEEEDFIAPFSVVSSTNPDNSIFVSSNIFTAGTANDFCIQRITPAGIVLWDYVYATNADPDRCHAILPTSDGGVIGIAREWQNGNKIFILDSLGNLILSQTIEIQFSVNDIIYSDEELIVGVGLGQSLDGFSTGEIFKMNDQGNILWDTVIGDGEAIGFQNQFYKVVHASDGGYVAGGTKKEFLPEEEVTAQTGSTRSQGWLVKFDEEGELVWERKYYYIDTPDDEHTLNDLEATSDGGYIFCGESTDQDWMSNYAYSEGPIQQGWLVKVDEHGCLVEGCQLADNINLPAGRQVEYFKAGPIPAGQFLNIYQNHNSLSGAVYQFIDMKGKVLEELPVMSKGTTLMLDVSEYPAGNYVLVLSKGNEILHRQKIVKE